MKNGFNRLWTAPRRAGRPIFYNTLDLCVNNCVCWEEKSPSAIPFIMPCMTLTFLWVCLSSLYIQVQFLAYWAGQESLSGHYIVCLAFYEMLFCSLWCLMYMSWVWCAILTCQWVFSKWRKSDVEQICEMHHNESFTYCSLTAQRMCQSSKVLLFSVCWIHGGWACKCTSDSTVFGSQKSVKLIIIDDDDRGKMLTPKRDKETKMVQGSVSQFIKHSGPKMNMARLLFLLTTNGCDSFKK